MVILKNYFIINYSSKLNLNLEFIFTFIKNLFVFQQLCKVEVRANNYSVLVYFGIIGYIFAHTGVFLLNTFDIQSIGSGMGLYNNLFGSIAEFTNLLVNSVAVYIEYFASTWWLRPTALRIDS
jgi:hypothetical protein